MTQENTTIVMPEPSGTSEISFHALGGLEGWNLTPSLDAKEDEIIESKKEE